MPLTTGTELKGNLPHEVGRWYENAKGVAFRFAEEPVRLFEGRGDGIRHHAPVELVTGRETHLVWRWDDTVLLPWWCNLLPRFVVAWLKPLPPETPVLPPSSEAKGDMS